MIIGPHILDNNLMPAPMAGVIDKPFRQLCRELGAGLTISEMITAYGEYPGVHIARKHTGWYCRNRTGLKPFLALVNQAIGCEEQLGMIREFFESSFEKGRAA